MKESNVSIHINVWSDFVCPWCFLAFTSLEKLQQTHGVEVIWRAYELRPADGPPIPPEYRAHIEAARPHMERIAREQYGVEIQSGPFGIDSRPALIGAQYAEAQGVGAAYHRAVFQAYWQQAQDIADRVVLRSLAEGAGLDGGGFEAALADPAWRYIVDGDIQQAQIYGLNGIPAMVFQNRYLVSGAQPHPVLSEIVEKIALREEGS
jgi:predicted DsbA family dithiol-disulfide isomerase